LSETQPLRALMRDRTVGLLVSVELLMSLGFGATATTLAGRATRAHDPLVLGPIGRRVHPAVVLALPAGHAADSHDRRRVTALGLAVVTVARSRWRLMPASGYAIWPLYAGVRDRNRHAYPPGRGPRGRRRLQRCSPGRWRC
jgi:hypothetical protein